MSKFIDPNFNRLVAAAITMKEQSDEMLRLQEEALHMNMPLEERLLMAESNRIIIESYQSVLAKLIESYINLAELADEMLETLTGIADARGYKKDGGKT